MSKVGEKSLIDIAKAYAIEKHAAVNHTYAGKPYSFHLEMVAETARWFVRDYPKAEQEVVIAAGWCHDIIEDARETYNDVKHQVGEVVAEIVYAVTNEKGRTRKERANDTYYAGIRRTPHATLVKLCDRIANVSFSRDRNSHFLEMYAREYPEFKARLYIKGELEEVWAHLEGLLKPQGT